jgi:hypothetical protein
MRSSDRLRRLAVAASGAVLLLIGCGPPQVAPQNLRLTASLRTALSARNAEWLEQNVRAIEERRSAGAMGDDEYAAFQSIVSQAKAGQWQEAERATVRLQQAQRPTQEQIDRLPKLVEG